MQQCVHQVWFNLKKYILYNTEFFAQITYQFLRKQPNVSTVWSIYNSRFLCFSRCEQKLLSCLLRFTITQAKNSLNKVWKLSHSPLKWNDLQFGNFTNTKAAHTSLARRRYWTNVGFMLAAVCDAGPSSNQRCVSCLPGGHNAQVNYTRVKIVAHELAINSIQSRDLTWKQTCCRGDSVINLFAARRWLSAGRTFSTLARRWAGVLPFWEGWSRMRQVDIAHPWSLAK